MSQPPDIKVYGAYWRPDCHRSKSFLGEHQIPYEFIDIEEHREGERFVIEANEGKRRIPTIVFGDGSTHANRRQRSDSAWRSCRPRKSP